jgi:hypothetical protein
MILQTSSSFQVFLNPQIKEQPDRVDPALIPRDLGDGFSEPFWNSGDLLSEHPVEGSPAHPVALCQLAQAVSVLPVAEDDGAVQNQRLPSYVPAF